MGTVLDAAGVRFPFGFPWNGQGAINRVDGPYFGLHSHYIFPNLQQFILAITATGGD